MEQTIAAIATAPGAGGIAIVRVSGREARSIAEKVFAGAGRALRPRVMTYGRIIDNQGAVIDEAMAVFFRAPRSYTREDVLELHCHGGSVQAERALAACLGAGARLAEPGEFTRRAFLSGRIDLSQAEAVMRVIGASSEQAAKLATAQLNGALAQAVRDMQDGLLAQIARLEAAIDYPEDDIEPARAAETEMFAADMAARLSAMLSQSRRAMRVSEGIRVAIVGRPNAGKSSLLNRLAGADRAIVTETPGTTRDVLSERVNLMGLPLTLLDTAGLRDSGDAIERMGVERARKELDAADIVLLVWDHSQRLSPDDLLILQSRKNVLLVKNKIDLNARQLPYTGPPVPAVEVSALTGEGMDALFSAIYDMAVGDEAIPETALMHERQAEAVRQAVAALNAASEAAANAMPPECLCEDLREAWRALGLITGDTADETLISRIFADFCLGK